MQHAERCRVLADHLRGVLALSAGHHYAAALALTRTALEHHLLDRLLFLANRTIQERTGLKPQDAPAEEARLAALKAGTRPDILKWWYDAPTFTMNVLIRGVFKEGSMGRGATVSPYYFHVERYDPFTVNKKVAPRVASAFGSRTSAQKWAEESEREWYRHFTFGRLRKSLDVNHLLRPRLGVQVDVHHAFLSAYVHGAQKAYDSVYSRNIPSTVGAFHHYPSELALLYVVAIAAAELEMFGRMSRRPPRLRLINWATVATEIAKAREASSYFWFLSGGPLMFDRIEEVHTRIPEAALLGNRKWSLVNPASLDVSRVRYYTNPLERLKKLHRSSREILTGLTFVSPFERDDARFQ
jgi:hypothetical protein